MSLFAVAGHPVAHSRSPALHHAWYEALGIDASYGRVDVDPASLPDGPQLLQRFDQLGLSGVNLTVPLKQLCMEAVVTLDPAAHLAGAINTLVREPDGWHGSNTDVEGFRRAAVDAGADLAGHTVVLGAGGAGRAVLAALLPSAARLTLLNRTVDTARSVAAALGGGIEVGPIRPGALRGADLVVVAVPGPGRSAIAGLELPELAPNAVWMDLNYWDPDPPLRPLLTQRGVRFDPGFRMLLHQGALAFERFCGCRPPLDVGWGVLLGAA